MESLANRSAEPGVGFRLQCAAASGVAEKAVVMEDKRPLATGLAT